MIRALTAPADQASRIENRVAEPTANPYYYFASQILSGLDGLTRNMTAPAAVETPYDSDADTLPDSLLSAIEHFEQSDFLRQAVSEWEQAEYFSLY